MVLISGETESTERTYPLTFSDEEGDEENPHRVVDEFVGIARIWIDNDHEGWSSGRPEIYVRILRFRFSTFSLLNQRENLPGVNDEQVWYNIGDPNKTYRYVSTSNYAPVIQYQVWEADSGFHGSDDHVGTVTLNWTGLPFGGYTTFASGDVRLRVDKD